MFPTPMGLTGRFIDSLEAVVVQESRQTADPACPSCQRRLVTQSWRMRLSCSAPGRYGERAGDPSRGDRRTASGTRCPCHHNLEEYLTAYFDGAGLRGDPKGPLFRTIGRGTGALTRTVPPQAKAYAMIRRGAAAAGIATKLGNRSFRATGITAYLKNPARWRKRR
jgi:hypothetical protein